MANKMAYKGMAPKELSYNCAPKVTCGNCQIAI
jgi:hypothetical protein